MEVVSCHKSCQVQESGKINRTEAEIFMNSKSEFYKAPMASLVATIGLSRNSEEAGRGGRGHPRGRGGGCRISFGRSPREIPRA